MTDRKKGRPDPVADLRSGFDGIFSALGEALSEISARLEDGQSGEVRRSFDLDTGKGPVRAEAGVRVRFAGQDLSGGSAARHKPVTPVNDPPPAPAPPATRAETPARSVDFEIMEDADTWRLTADIPGVDRGDLTLRAEDGELVIETTGTRRFRGTAPLPVGVGVEDIEISLRNGILELSCPRPGGGAP